MHGHQASIFLFHTTNSTTIHLYLKKKILNIVQQTGNENTQTC